MRLSRKIIRQNRLWSHFLYWLGDGPHFHSDGSRWDDYEPERWRKTFLNFQSNGRRGLSPDEIDGITPLIDGQRRKELTLNSLVIEMLIWDSEGWGYIHPAMHVLETKMDRLTRLSVLRTLNNIRQCEGFGRRVWWYIKHPVRKKNRTEFRRALARFRSHYAI